MARLVLCFVVTASVLASSDAAASIWITSDAHVPSLRVDARGNAEVVWRDTGGARHTLLVPSRGRVLPGGHAGRDVSRRVTPNLPLARVVRRTPDGRSWALQAWRVRASGPIELHLARWRGEPPSVTAAFGGERIAGSVSFHGAGMYGRSPTPDGKLLRVAAYVDCFECSGSPGWGRMLAVFPGAPDGAFAVLLRPTWQASLYRVTVYGKNSGTTLAPDTRVMVRAVT